MAIRVYNLMSGNEIRADGFEWDFGNSLKSWLKHGISKNQTEEVFFNDPAIMDDVQHSSSEQRYYAYGCMGSGKLVLVAFTLRCHEDKILIRPISSRPMNNIDRHFYEETLASYRG